MTVPGGRQIENGSTSIEPGKTQKVAVSIPTKYIRTKDVFTKNVEIETNDPDARVIQLTMKLKVEEILAITPAFVSFGNVTPGSTNKREVTIINKGKNPFTITRILVVPDSVLAVSSPGPIKMEPGKSITCEVTYSPSLPDDRFLGTLQVETDLETIQSKIVQVRATVVKK